MNNVQLVKKSSNAKTGPIPTTTSSRSTCPPACPLAGAGGCYAEAGHYTRMNWDKVDSGERGVSYSQFTKAISMLKPDTLWRHNVAGDLSGANDIIDTEALEELVAANTGRRGFTYTHYPMDNQGNLTAISQANVGGFTVNVSHNTPQEAIAATHGQPKVTLVPEDYWANGNRVDGIVRCPAETSDTITCATCQLCQRSSRKDIVGFTVHGTRKASANIIAVG